jgi:hypothetical protein
MAPFLPESQNASQICENTKKKEVFLENSGF